MSDERDAIEDGEHGLGEEPREWMEGMEPEEEDTLGPVIPFIHFMSFFEVHP